MNKKYFDISIFLVVVIVISVILNKNSTVITIPNNDQYEWITTTDCKDIKLYFWDGKNPSESGLEDEQDIVMDYEKKIISVGLNEVMYGPRKRLEVSYSKPGDYADCSSDVKKLINVTVGVGQ